MSAIIDREAAAAEINAAHAKMAGAQKSMAGMMNEIYNLSTEIKAQNDSGMYKAMDEYWKGLKTTCNTLQSTFEAINQQLMVNVNNVGGTDSRLQTLKKVEYPTINGNISPKFHNVFTGIGKMSTIAGYLQSYANITEELSGTFESVIKCYSNLYFLASEGPYETMMQNAHEAANQVRVLSQKIATWASEFASQINHHLNYWTEKEGQNDRLTKENIATIDKIAKSAIDNIKMPAAF